jgi:nitrogen regulatory protein PII
MTLLVVLIVDDPNHCGAILQGWEDIGVSGVTILESTGLGRLRRGALIDDLPLMPSLSDFDISNEERHRTLLSVVHDEVIVEKMIAVVEQVIGDLDEPNTGFLFIVPVIKAIGLGRKG